MTMNRRQFFKLCAVGAATSAISALGLMSEKAFASVRGFKLLRAKETRNNCCYCSVGCGLLMYSQSSNGKNAEQSIFHIEGDADNPINRGALCPKGAGLVDYVNSPHRLKYPEVRLPGSDKWQRISWDEAFKRIARLIKDERDANLVEKNAQGQTVNRLVSLGMMTSSAQANEGCYITHKFGRAIGMLGIDNIARVCHAPTPAAMAPTFGRGAMTNHWADMKNTDLAIVMGGNAAEAHPVGFGWVTEAMEHNNVKLIVVDPRFNRSAAVADLYAPIRSGTDIAFLLGMIRYLLETQQINLNYVKAYTNASFIVREDFEFNEGLFSGYDEANHKYDQSTWFYELDEEGYAKVDPSLSHPRCVINLLKKHVDRYDPDTVSSITGTPKETYLEVCQQIGATHVDHKAATFLYALGWTQHSVGAQNIRTMAMIQLLLGNMGIMGGGVNALRGHSNVQGATDLGLLCQALPGYLKLPQDKDVDLQNYLAHYTPKALRPNQTNYWHNYPAFTVSLLKAFFGEHATAENDYGYDWLPKWDQQYDINKQIDMMVHGEVNGYFIQGINALNSQPDKQKVSKGLSNLKFLVVLDALANETSTFWRNAGQFNDVNTASIQTEVFRLPTTCFAEESGSIANSSRWLQWHFKGANPPGEALSDPEILSGIMLELKRLYREEGGRLPAPIEAIKWDYAVEHEPSSEEIAREMNGYDLTTGKLLNGFSELKADGSTSCGVWVYSGMWTEAGNLMARRDNSDPSGKGITPNWSFAWPANRRILYNRASCDVQGKPRDPSRVLLEYKDNKWQGIDVPDFNAKLNAEDSAHPFIMQADGVGHLFALRDLKDGPFPEHYEPFESPLASNPLHPKVTNNPVARMFKGLRESFGTNEEFPYVGTTYSMTEHFNNWTTHCHLAAITQPQHFIEIDETLAAEKGINNGDWVKVSSKRSHIVTKAYVTKRLQPMMVQGKKVHTIGIPRHGSYEALTQKSYIVNELTSSVGDANTQTPEYKAFLVNIAKAEGF